MLLQLLWGDNQHFRLRLARSISVVLAAAFLAGEYVVGAVTNCSALSAARLVNASLERCLQRCRDDVSAACQWVGWNLQVQQCAIGVDQAGCGIGWVLHGVPPPSSMCSYGFGRVDASAVCTKCAAGMASHADVGDLADTWEMYHEGNVRMHSVLTVNSSGQATYEDPDLGTLLGQYVLFHSRADLNYPGAFFIEYFLAASPEAGVQAWDYAWLEDTGDGGRLVTRRFCGRMVESCQASHLSPEGSPFFQYTMVANRSLASLSPTQVCPVLGPAEIVRTCCDAATAVSRAQDSTKIVATIDSSMGRQWTNVPVAPAVWNRAPPYPNLQNLSIMINSADPSLCDKGRAQFGMAGVQKPYILFALRGNCSFFTKGEVAAFAGAEAVLLMNVGDMVETLLTPAGQEGSDPGVPVWMFNETWGGQVLSAINTIAKVRLRAIGSATSLPSNDDSLGRLCCAPVCRAAAEAALVAGRSTGLDTPSACGSVNCFGYVEPPAPAPQPHAIILPGSGRPLCAPCPEGSVSEVDGLASCLVCAPTLVSNAARTLCVSSAATLAPTPLVPTAAPIVVSATSGGASDSSSSTKVEFNWTTFFAVICCVLIFCIGTYCLKRFWWRNRDGGAGTSFTEMFTNFTNMLNPNQNADTGETVDERTKPSGDAERGNAAGSSKEAVGSSKGGDSAKSEKPADSAAGAGAKSGTTATKTDNTPKPQAGGGETSKVVNIGPLRITYGQKAGTGRG